MSTIVISETGQSVGVESDETTVVIDDGDSSSGGDVSGEAAARIAADLAFQADLEAEEAARLANELEQQADIDAIVSGGGLGDMLSTNFASEYVGHEAEVQANLGLGTAAVEDVTAFSTPADVQALEDALRTAAFRDVGTTSDTVAAGNAPTLAVDAMPTVDTTDNAKAFFDTQDVGAGELVTFLDVTNLASLDDIVAGSVDSVNGESGVVTLSAADVPFTPDGSIAATTVQDAIVEVRDEAGGGGTGLLFQFIQDVASDLWLVGHDLGAYVNVTVVDSLIRQVEADVQYVDANNITIGFATATTGQAFLS